MPYAVKLESETVEELIDWGKSVNMNLDHLRYEVVPEFPELGDNYLITDGTSILDNVTCTVMCASDFFRIWKFVDGELPSTHFSKIEKV